MLPSCRVLHVILAALMLAHPFAPAAAGGAEQAASKQAYEASQAKQAGHANQAGDAKQAGHASQVDQPNQGGHANQADQANEANNGNDVHALAGIVVSRTITVGGQEFGQGFLAAWRDMPDSERHTLTIVERPSARWGSEVWIEYAQRRIFHARLPNARAVLRRAGEQAAEATFQAILQAERQRKLVHDADLAPDEF